MVTCNSRRTPQQINWIPGVKEMEVNRASSGGLTVWKNFEGIQTREDISERWTEWNTRNGLPGVLRG